MGIGCLSIETMPMTLSSGTGSGVVKINGLETSTPELLKSIGTSVCPSFTRGAAGEAAPPGGKMLRKIMKARSKEMSFFIELIPHIPKYLYPATAHPARASKRNGVYANIPRSGLRPAGIKRAAARWNFRNSEFRIQNGDGGYGE